MEALYLLVPLSIAIVFAAIWLFFRMSDGGQFDDLVSPGWRILQDDDKAPASSVPSEIPLKDDTVSH
jgi:cbb3-type cytochrome oxidase maturation protein